MTATPLPPLATDRKPSAWIGIDPGVTGAIAAIIEGAPLPALFPMPTLQITTGTGKTKKNKTILDERKLRSIFAGLQEQCGEIYALIETAQLRPAMRHSGHNCPICTARAGRPVPHMIAGQGLTSQAEFHGGYKLIRGILCGLGIGYESIPANTWKVQVFADTGFSSSDKDDARELAAKLYPIVAGKFKLIKSHGLAESLLLADYNRKRNEAPF